ncbi:MAG: hypothetical protein DWQ02_19260 [Bacteroidetes bacterium]|nr:MAG: hypothetical protein DWQ02_19260 [Bacteroidota bacterium]
MKRRLYITLAILHLFVAIGAIPAGYALFTKPDGSSLGMPTEWLEGSPFPDFFIPGLFLFIILGLGNLLTAMPIFKQHKLSGIAGLSMGGILVIWIIIQVVIVGLASFLQPLFFFVGLIQLMLGYWIFRLAKV